MSAAPFVRKLFTLVSAEEHAAIVSWHPLQEDVFVIRDPYQLSKTILNRYYKHSNLSSFIRQLNTYGFKKNRLDAGDQQAFGREALAFHHPHFRRGSRDELLNITRRKPNGPSKRKHSALDEDEAEELAQLRVRNEQLERRVSELSKELAETREQLEAARSEPPAKRFCLEAPQPEIDYSSLAHRLNVSACSTTQSDSAIAAIAGAHSSGCWAGQSSGDSALLGAAKMLDENLPTSPASDYCDSAISSSASFAHSASISLEDFDWAASSWTALLMPPASPLRPSPEDTQFL